MTNPCNHPKHWLADWPKPTRQSHKYSRGAALIYGATSMTGAARLSALACARAGAGATTIACAESVWPIYATTLLSIMVRACRDWNDALACLDSKPRAVLIGPGQDATAQTRQQVLALLQQPIPALVLDAGAISAFSEQSIVLFEAIQNSHTQVVLTPHEGEFARLFPDLAVGDLSKSQRSVMAAQRSGASVVLKGNDTVIAHPTGQWMQQLESSPYLATAGSGDVLAGIITGLLAQGMPTFQALCAAVWMHSQAGQALGVGLIAEDLIAILPQIGRQLLTYEHEPQ